MSRHRFTEANAIFKSLRGIGWVDKSVSRRKALRALVTVLDLECEGDIPPPKSNFPYINPLLSESGTYNSVYLDQAFGVLRYLRGDYSGGVK